MNANKSTWLNFRRLMLLKSGDKMIFKTELEYYLAASILFSVALAITGSLFSGSIIFGFLVWNLFLAIIPYAISNWMQRNVDWNENRLKFCLVFGVWLLFVPNSFYIITDLFHLGSFSKIPLWYELAMILSFAWNGLLLGILSVRQMEKMIKRYGVKRTTLLFIYPVMFLNALGVYIGRYLRFNSWDVITNPFQLIKDIASLLLHPIQFKYDWGMVICFSIFLTLIFLTLISATRINTNVETN